jgi:hypothetical protein
MGKIQIPNGKFIVLEPGPWDASLGHERPGADGFWLIRLTQSESK